MSLPRGYKHIHFHDIQTSFFFETTGSMKAIPYGVSLRRKNNFCFIDRRQIDQMASITHKLTFS